MIAFPQAKINLGLSVIRKRNDGYHDISTLMYPLPFCDVLEILPSASGKVSFKQTGLLIGGKNEDNLCLKAWAFMEKKYQVPPCSIHLHKAIPWGAGLGGGSSDAASTILLLNDLFNLQLNPAALTETAASIGSDCPFFISGKPAIASGRGEVLQEIMPDLKGVYLMLIKPAFGVSTAEAYAGVKPSGKEMGIEKIVLGSKEHWKDKLKNDFEESVFAKHPELAVIKNHLYTNGAFYASMTGSGSAMFGMFEKEIEISGIPAEICWKGWL
jgi:4-diphosphocytidyl-2-C-methyl-D-erythritol kinase